MSLVQDDLFANYASWLAGVLVKTMSNYPVCWIGIPAAQLDRARFHHESHNIEKFKRKAGGRYAADLVLQLPARGSGSVALHCDYQNYSDQ